MKHNKNIGLIIASAMAGATVGIIVKSLIDCMIHRNDESIFEF